VQEPSFHCITKKIIKMNHLQNSLIRLKNGYGAQKSTIKLRNTKKSVIFLKLLKKHGFIKAWHALDSRELKIHLKYVFGTPCIKSISSFIRPSMPIYLSFSDLNKIKNSFGILILNTSHGLLTKDEALRHQIGGSLVCLVK
jgi:small subunit ribosomal protein S8